MHSTSSQASTMKHPPEHGLGCVGVAHPGETRLCNPSGWAGGVTPPASWTPEQYCGSLPQATVCHNTATG